MRYNYLTDTEIKHIKDNLNDIDQLLLFIDALLDDISQEAYDQGYDDGVFEAL